MSDVIYPSLETTTKAIEEFCEAYEKTLLELNPDMHPLGSSCSNMVSAFEVGLYKGVDWAISYMEDWAKKNQPIQTMPSMEEYWKYLEDRAREKRIIREGSPILPHINKPNEE